MGTIYLGTIASLGAGLATAVGALPILFTDKLSQKWQGILLGLGGGVMLAATAFSLIIPGKEAAGNLGYSQAGSALIVSIGMIVGASLLWLMHNFFPHEHFQQGKEGRVTENFERLWLFIIAITIHNFPEGLAVGVGFGDGSVSHGLPLALGIGLQNLPEGLVVALALRELEYSVNYALGISLLTGLVEPIGAYESQVQLTVQVRGDVYNVLQNDQVLLEGVPLVYSGGRMGLTTWNSAVEFDNIEVTNR